MIHIQTQTILHTATLHVFVARVAAWHCVVSYAAPTGLAHRRGVQVGRLVHPAPVHVADFAVPVYPAAHWR